MQKKQLFVRDVDIDTDIEMLIPDFYVSNIQERLLLYTELDKLETEEGIEKFAQMLKDRFGNIPTQVFELFDGLRLRALAKKLGFERIILKNRKMNCYFISNAQSIYFETSVFQNILKYVSNEGQKQGFTMKQSNNYLILTKENVKTLKEAKSLLEQIVNNVVD